MLGTCPTCRTPLDTSGRSASCHTCRGLWVATATLGELIAEMQAGPSSSLAAMVVGGTAATSPIDFVEGISPEVARACPTCDELMQHGRLDDIEFDRCARHGYWFDADELSAVLRLEHVAPTAPRRTLLSSLRAWLGA